MLNGFLLGLVRKFNVSQWGEGANGPVACNPRGDLSVVQGLPERSELVRAGCGWGAAIPTGSAFTFVAAWPTTRSELVLCNAEPAGGKTYILDRLWMCNISSQAAAQPYSLLGQITPQAAGIAAASDNSAVLRHQLSGKATTYGGNAHLALASTAFALTNQWFALGNSVMSPMTTNLGGSLEVQCYGRYLLPPGAAFSLAGLAGTAAGTAIVGIEWYEVQLDSN